ncbi:MAG: hypothetical protein LUE92_14790 [Clostridiales bacterium]|nr:hypothetical protein [Clostridiales bacterium]
MSNFAIAASQETIEFANKIMEIYAQNGDKKEDTLLRILNLAEEESIKGTHPELHGMLKAIDTTITTLIKQINGIVAGQDNQLQDLRVKLEKAIEEKRIANETAKNQTDEAQVRKGEADAYIKQAQEEIEIIKAQAKAEIDSAKRDAGMEIEKANTERDQALRERDDARTISAEKTANNDLLMRQMNAMEADVQAYKDLQNKYDQLSENLSSLRSQFADKERELVTQKKDEEASQKALEADFNHRIETVKAQEELAIEKAVIAREREISMEYQKQIRQSDKENALLSAQISQLRARIVQLEDNTKISKR